MSCPSDVVPSQCEPDGLSDGANASRFGLSTLVNSCGTIASTQKMKNRIRPAIAFRLPRTARHSPPRRRAEAGGALAGEGLSAMTALLIDTSKTAAAGAPPTRRRGSGVVRAALRSRKAMVGLVLFAIFSVMAIAPQLFTSVRRPNRLAFEPSLHPSGDHWLGTTSLGQDIWAQLVYGTRESLVIALVAGFFATVLAVLVGVSAAYLGGIADEFLSLVTNVFLVLPTFPLIIVLATYAGKGTLTVVLVVLVVTGWSYGANQMRAQTLSLRNRDFLESARVRGERKLYIIVVEILPTMTSLIVANFLGAALYSVLTAIRDVIVGRISTTMM